MTGNMIGRVFNNRYQITERIGIGGMAEVYRAQDTMRLMLLLQGMRMKRASSTATSSRRTSWCSPTAT